MCATTQYDLIHLRKALKAVEVDRPLKLDGFVKMNLQRHCG